MASVATKRMTASEFFEWVQQPANRDRSFELEKGEVVEMPPPGKFHGFVCGNIARLLGNYAHGQGHGYVCTNDAGVIVEDDPATVRGPDATYYVDAQTAEDMTRGYADQPPLLAVEVLSPTDRVGPTMQRVTQLLDRGVRLVWVIDLEAREVTVCRNGRNVQLLPISSQLTGGEELPGFSVPVSELFSTPGPSPPPARDN